MIPEKLQVQPRMFFFFFDVSFVNRHRFADFAGENILIGRQIIINGRNYYCVLCATAIESRSNLFIIENRMSLTLFDPIGGSFFFHMCVRS